MLQNHNKAYAYVPGPVGNEVESVDEVALLLKLSK